MNRALAAWLTSWSRRDADEVHDHHLGHRPEPGHGRARPPPRRWPTSEIGVSRTRSVPNAVDSPLVTWEMPPPGSARSSPMSSTVGIEGQGLGQGQVEGLAHGAGGGRPPGSRGDLGGAHRRHPGGVGVDVGERRRGSAADRRPGRRRTPRSTSSAARCSMAATARTRPARPRRQPGPVARRRARPAVAASSSSGGDVAHGVAEVVAAEPEGGALDQGGPSAGPGPGRRPSPSAPWTASGSLPSTVTPGMP